MTKGVGDEIKMLITVIIVGAVVLLAILMATGALKPLSELASEASITNILKIFGITGGTK
jgi:hypothetical protein